MRKPLLIDRQTEGVVIEDLIAELKTSYPDLDPTNTIVVMVSPDYSATVAMHMAHGLSKDGNMCDLMMVDVPYPDQEKENGFIYKLIRTIDHTGPYKNYVLAEAGIIRGGNYTWICETMKRYIPDDSRIITTTMYENIHSTFKSDVVGRYYNDETEDLTFYYEEYNKHWD